MPVDSPTDRISLTAYDLACLQGETGEAAARAMQFLLGIARAQGAHRLVDVEHCHLVGAYFSGAADLNFLQRLVDAGARVRVPTTLNASSACLATASLSPKQDRDAAAQVIRLYKAMGCDAQLTCAPYHLPYRPGLGDRIAWAESNAVVFANAVLGARSNRTVQYLDLCAALTGRIPEYGLYLDAMRAPTCHVDCSALSQDAWASTLTGELIGLWLGHHCGTQVPFISGCLQRPAEDLLRGLGAAAASAGALSLFHLQGVTPEAQQFSEVGLPSQKLTNDALITMASDYRGKTGQEIRAVCLGAPHYSLDQLRTLAERVRAENLQAKIPFYVTTSRYNRDRLLNELLAGDLASRGVQLVTDACSYYGNVIPNPGGPVITDSAKWAYYGSGNLGIPALLGDLEDCLATAASGRLTRTGASPWL